MPRFLITFAFFGVCVSIFVYFIFPSAKETHVSPLCPDNYFRVDMNTCHPFLECKNIENITVLKPLAEGVVKDVYLAKWNFIYVVVSKLKNNLFEKDFNHNIFMLRSLGKSRFITEFIGNCSKQNILVTKYYPFGNALNFPIIMKKLPKSENICFNFCVSFVEVINYLHSSPIGIRVMCDSNSLSKLLSQFLITQSLHVVANDLDALPAVTDKGIKCGHREIVGTFAAPEQLWPFSDRSFNDSEMPAYNEKVDIWKIPDVCNWAMSFCHINETLLNHLNVIHSKCKSRNPEHRPSASEVLDFYEETAVKHNIFNIFIENED